MSFASKQIRDINLSAVRRSLMPDKSKTAGEIAAETNLSIVTVNALLKDMSDCKEVTRGAGVSAGGRPGAVYAYNSRYKLAAVVYGFFTDNIFNIVMSIVDFAGDSIYRKAISVSEVLQSSFDFLLDDAFEKFGNIAVIAFGLPGVEKNGIILLNDIRALEGGQFISHIQQRYSTKALFANDINAAANGFYHRCARNCESAAAIWFPRRFCPGVGLVINGKIHKGWSNFAGEIVALPIGVDWSTLDYDDKNVLEEAASKLAASVCCIAAPERTVLYGDVWREQSGQNISLNVKNRLGCAFEIETQTARWFETDFELGLTLEAINSITFS